MIKFQFLKFTSPILHKNLVDKKNKVRVYLHPEELLRNVTCDTNSNLSKHMLVVITNLNILVYYKLILTFPRFHTSNHL